MLNKFTQQVSNKLNKNLQEVSSTLKQMGTLDLNEEGGYVWIADDSFVDDDVLFEYGPVLDEVLDELDIDFMG